MDKYQIIELELAELLGFKEHPCLPGELFHRWEYPCGTILAGRPYWASNDKDAFALMVSEGLSVYVDTHPNGCQCVEVEFFLPHKPSPYDEGLYPSMGTASGSTVENFDDHVGRNAAVRYAICHAVKLKYLTKRKLESSQ